MNKIKYRVTCFKKGSLDTLDAGNNFVSLILKHAQNTTDGCELMEVGESLPGGMFCILHVTHSYIERVIIGGTGPLDPDLKDYWLKRAYECVATKEPVIGNYLEVQKCKK